MNVANIILQQLGGNKFIAMTGAKNFGKDETSISFKIGKNAGKFTHVTIRLNSMDTYNMFFLKIRGANIKAQKVSDVYNDMLQDVFTEKTGLSTYL